MSRDVLGRGWQGEEVGCRRSVVDFVPLGQLRCWFGGLDEAWGQRNTELGLLLSGGVDSCAILEACSLAGAPLTRAVTVSIVDDPDQIPEDERYATEAVMVYNATRKDLRSRSKS